MGKNKTSIKKGEIKNPSGRPVGTKLIPQELKSINAKNISETLARFTKLSAKDLVVIMNDPETKTLELMIGKIVAEAIKHGDQTRLNFILDRMIGKVKEVIEIDARSEVNILVSTIDLDERIKLLKGTD